MKRCVFCAVAENGVDLADDHESLVDLEVSMDTTVKIDITQTLLGITTNRKEEVCIPGDTDKPCIDPYHVVYVDGHDGILWSYLIDEDGCTVWGGQEKDQLLSHVWS